MTDVTNNDYLAKLIQIFYEHLDGELTGLFKNNAFDVSAENATTIIINALSIMLEMHGLIISSDAGDESKDKITYNLDEYIEYTKAALDVVAQRFLGRIDYIKHQKELH